nr:high affinity cAMP-specific and IBMX-insensitive 3',5'-cyclic phosphodiesterase 8A-like [Lytechinus pictus]
MDEINNFVSDYSKRLSRPIKDLDDVRNAMAALEMIRQQDIRIDMTLGPIEEAYSMLQKFQVSVPREEANRVDSLRYSFQKLSRQASSVQANLVKIQPEFKGELLTAVETFHVDNIVAQWSKASHQKKPMLDSKSSRIPQLLSFILSLYARATNSLFAALENSSDAIQITSENRTVQYVNPAYERISGYTNDEVIGHEMEDMPRCDKNKVELIDGIYSQLKKGKSWEGMLYSKKRNGESIPQIVYIAPVIGYGGKVRHHVFNKRFPAQPTNGPAVFSQELQHNVDKMGQDFANGHQGLNRRQSVARIHSMTIEAPITKVINIINTAQENSPSTVVQNILFQRYNLYLYIFFFDRAVLESHHSALAFQLTTKEDRCNIFKELDRDDFRALRHSIIDMILATEMTKHFEHLSKFVNCINKPGAREGDDSSSMQSGGRSTPDTMTLSTPENRALVRRMLIKCADVANPTRPLELCKEWARRISQEYFNQTDEEKRRGLPVVMPVFDRTVCSIPKSQISFIDYFIMDMFEAWDSFADCPELMEHLQINYVYWKGEEEKDREKKMKEKENEKGDNEKE